jgi:NAD(P)H dehydrogenase (quinone)
VVQSVVENVVDKVVDNSVRWVLSLAGVAVLALAQPALAQAPDRIIVSGASGQLGGLVVDNLLARGVEARNLVLVSRTTQGLEKYAALGATLRFGDFTQPESLPAAYAGGTRLLLISINPLPNRPQLHKNAIDAAIKAGVRHIVYASSVDADNPGESQSAAEHRLTERFIRESGAAWTMMRHHLYMNGLVQQAARMVADGKVTIQPDEVPAAYVTREDCAAADAAVLSTPGHENKIYEITGPELVLRRDVARIASELSGRRIEEVPGPGGVSQVAAVMSGFAAFRSQSNAVADLTGRPATSVRQLLEKNRDQLLSAVKTP